METKRVPVSAETLALLKEIEIRTKLKKSAVYASCLAIGAQMEIEKINQLKAKYLKSEQSENIISIEELPKLLADFLIYTNKNGTINKGSYIDIATKYIKNQLKAKSNENKN